MKHPAKLLKAVALSAFSMASGTLLADDCSYPGPLGTCPAGTFELVYMDGAGAMTEDCETRAPCANLDSKIGPSPSFIVCSPVSGQSGHFRCEAWPQGDLSYDWVLDAGVEALDLPFQGGPVRDVGCGSRGAGRVLTVTVTAPNGAEDTAFTQISCPSG